MQWMALGQGQKMIWMDPGKNGLIGSLNLFNQSFQTGMSNLNQTLFLKFHISKIESYCKGGIISTAKEYY